jgi:hypothetical protein
MRWTADIKTDLKRQDVRIGGGENWLRIVSNGSIWCRDVKASGYATTVLKQAYLSYCIYCVVL